MAEMPLRIAMIRR